jgi:hypothetical protein
VRSSSPGRRRPVNGLSLATDSLFARVIVHAAANSSSTVAAYVLH